MKRVRLHVLAGGSTRLLVASLGGALVLVSTVWTALQSPRPDFVSEQDAGPIEGKPASGILALETGPDEPEFAGWTRTEFAEQGSVSRFDLFTPPGLYPDLRAGRWSNEPPAVEENSAGPGPDGVRDVPTRVTEISAVVFPLQLVGFGRSPRGVFGVFQQVASRGTAVLRAGDRDPGLGLRIVSLEECRGNDAPDDETGTDDRRPRARVLDESTGGSTILVAGEWRMVEDPKACVHYAGAPDGRWMQAGEVAESGDEVLLVESIDVSRRTVVLVGGTEGGGPDRRRHEFTCTLSIRVSEDPSPANPPLP